MWNNDKNQNIETEPQTIETVELDNVLGGCACGCGQANCTNCANCPRGTAQQAGQFGW